MQLKLCKGICSVPHFILFHVSISTAVMVQRLDTLMSVKKFSRRCLPVKDGSNYKEFPDSRLHIRVNQNLLLLILVLIRDRLADIMYTP